MTKLLPIAAHEAEACVVGALLLEPERMATAQALLSPEDFTEPRYRAVYATMLDGYRKLRPYSFPGLCEALKAAGLWVTAGALDGLVAMMQMPLTPAHFTHNVRVLVNTSVLRETARIAGAVTADVETVRGGDHGDVCAFVADLQERLKAVGDRATAALANPTLADALDAARIAAALPPDTRPPIRTNLLDLDEFGTLLRPGSLVVVGGRPGAGKSTLLLHMALEAAKGGAHALFVSLEMPAREIAERVAARTLGQPKPPNGFSEDAYGYVRGDEAHTRLHIKATTGMTADALYAEAKAAKARGEAKILFVDYLQLLRGRRAENRQQEVSFIARALKSIALDLDIPVVAAAQLNRSVMHSDEPSMGQLRESGDIEASADVVILAWRKDEEEGILNVKVDKHRAGRTGKIRLSVALSTYTVRDAARLGTPLEMVRFDRS